MRLLAAAVLAAALPAVGAAHEVHHEVDRGRAVALVARHGDGAPLADAAFEVFSPADREAPWLMGRTDRHGWLAFVPDAPGRWRVRVYGDDGHGLDVEVDVDAVAPRSAAPGATASYVVRPLLGALAVGAVFAALVAIQRRRGAAR